MSPKVAGATRLETFSVARHEPAKKRQESSEKFIGANYTHFENILIIFCSIPKAGGPNKETRCTLFNLVGVLSSHCPLLSLIHI